MSKLCRFRCSTMSKSLFFIIALGNWALQYYAMRYDMRLRTMTKRLQWKWNDTIQFALHTIELPSCILSLSSTVGKIGEYSRNAKVHEQIWNSQVFCDFESSFITLYIYMRA